VLNIENAGKGESFIMFYRGRVEFHLGASQKIQFGLAHKYNYR